MSAHSGNIQGAFATIVGGIKQGEIVPNLLYNKITLNKGYAAFGVYDNITDIITKRFIYRGSFRVKDTYVHWCFSLSFLDILIIARGDTEVNTFCVKFG